MCIEAMGKEAASRPRFGQKDVRESLGGYKLQCYKLIFRSAAHRFLDDFLCLSLANKRTPRKSALPGRYSPLGSILLSGGIFARRDQTRGCENTICFASAFTIVSNQQRGLESTIQQHTGRYIGARVYYVSNSSLKDDKKKLHVYTLLARGGGGGGGISETYIRACKPRRKPTAYTKSALALAIK
ncbi:hypothetical protein ALC53_01842 [Atta colombica]|uniref:Uncharacterized protein n=1 Tax=Atta colombica TaxID=520822 RepID=A0A151I5Q6_9HYME|nr:hypothetical protein ALC53_01842 [Atta colombica]